MDNKYKYTNNIGRLIMKECNLEINGERVQTSYYCKICEKLTTIDVWSGEKSYLSHICRSCELDEFLKKNKERLNKNNIALI